MALFGLHFRAEFERILLPQRSGVSEQQTELVIRLRRIEFLLSFIYGLHLATPYNSLSKFLQ